MANKYDDPEDWELWSLSSGKLKKSSSVEILLGTHRTRGRLLASSPDSTNGRVTSHNMKGSGRPTSTMKSATLPPSVAPPFGSMGAAVLNGDATKTMPKDSETMSTRPRAVNEKEKNTALPSELAESTDSLDEVPELPPPPPPPPPPPHPPASGTKAPGKEKGNVMDPELTGSNSSLMRMSEISPPRQPQPSSPLSFFKNLLGSDSSLRRMSETPPPSQSGVLGAPQSPPQSRINHLPPLVTTINPEYQSANSTPRGTPKGTPIIGKRGHVFSVLSPEVKPETRQPLPPLYPAGGTKPKRTLAECVGDPFEQRRRIKPSAGESEETHKVESEGGGDGDEEPVWHRRLSLLFVPPTEDDLEDPDKEVEETTRLLPKTLTPHILRKQSTESVSTPPLSRKQEREERANKKKEKEEKARKKDRDEIDSQDKENTEGKEKASPRSKKEEARNTKLKPLHIIFQEEKRENSKGDNRRPIHTKFSSLRRSSISDDPASSSPCPGTSDEEEEEEKEEEEEEEEEDEEEREPGPDGYTSWDDTICSNRSSYFKHYYAQRGVIGRSAEEREGTFKSFFGTSQNSLSSLIREKMGKPPANQGKKGVEVGLVVLVVVLLVLIVVGISLTTYFYNLHLLELFIFNRIKFYETPRLLEVYDDKWQPLITAHLGTNLPENSIPEDCTDYLNYLQKRNYTLPHHGLDDDEYEDMMCLDWTALAQLHLRKLYSSGSVQCYSVWWVALKDDFTLRDCLKADSSHGTWWGGGEMTAGGYPISRADVPPETMVTGKLERDPWGQLLRRAWLSDRGSLLILPAKFLGHISVNHELDEQVCIEVPTDPSVSKPPKLSYTLCIAPNLTALTGYMHQRAVIERHMVGMAMPSLVNYSMEAAQQEDGEGETGEAGLMKENFRQEVTTRVEERLENPVWIPWMTPDSPQLTQDAVLDYVDRVLGNNSFGLWGHMLLPATWQTRPGEMEFDPERFPDPKSLSQTLKTKGFHLALTVHPFVSVDAPAFEKGTTENLWVRQKSSVLPAMASYDESHPSVVTDFTNPRSRRWYASQLQQLMDKYGIDRFHLQPADAHALPTYHDHHVPVPTPDATLVSFMASVSSVSPPVSTEGTVTPPLPPTFITMGTGDGSWDGLETLIPRVLTLATLGYPFIDVGPIGGLARAGHVPERELYIRWIEAAAFLPAMQISVLPSTYGDDVEELAREYLALRKELVLPRLLDRVQDALENGTPLITPLSLFVPDDPEAAGVDDQWMLGDDLLVAPVTRRGERTRTFYLPQGIWRDEIDGHLRSGGRWVKNYKVPLTKIPHFTLKYINDFET